MGTVVASLSVTIAPVQGAPLDDVPVSPDEYCASLLATTNKPPTMSKPFPTLVPPTRVKLLVGVVKLDVPPAEA